VLIYVFRKAAGELALTIDVTGKNIPSIDPTTSWTFLDTIDTLVSPPPWDLADFQCLLTWLQSDGYYLLEADVRDLKRLGAGWVRPSPADAQQGERSPPS
jgi:hypothetical protein